VRTLPVAELLFHVEAVALLQVTEPFLGESPGVSSLNVPATLALSKWDALFQGVCWTCNLFRLE